MLFTHSITELFKYNTSATDRLKENNICFVLNTPSASLLAENQSPIPVMFSLTKTRTGTRTMAFCYRKLKRKRF